MSRVILQRTKKHKLLREYTAAECCDKFENLYSIGSNINTAHLLECNSDINNTLEYVASINPTIMYILEASHVPTSDLLYNPAAVFLLRSSNLTLQHNIGGFYKMKLNTEEALLKKAANVEYEQTNIINDERIHCLSDLTERIKMTTADITDFMKHSSRDVHLKVEYRDCSLINFSEPFIIRNKGGLELFSPARDFMFNYEYMSMLLNNNGSHGWAELNKNIHLDKFLRLYMRRNKLSAAEKIELTKKAERFCNDCALLERAYYNHCDVCMLSCEVLFY
jgi:hypothetical protein